MYMHVYVQLAYSYNNLFQISILFVILLAIPTNTTFFGLYLVMLYRAFCEYTNSNYAYYNIVDNHDSCMSQKRLFMLIIGNDEQ